MRSQDGRETAKIVDFDTARRARDGRRSAGEGAPPQPVRVSTGAWYHEAAVKDEDRTRRS